MKVRYSALREPQPHRLDALQQRVAGHDHPCKPEGGGFRPEGSLQLVQETPAGAAVGPSDPALHRVEDPVERRAQRRPICREEEDRGRQHAEHDEVQEPIHGDHPQHVLVPQRPSPQRKLDLGTLGQMLAPRCIRRRQRHPRVAAHAAVPAQSIAGLPHEEIIFWADRRDVGADQFVAAQPAADQLVVQPPPDTGGPLGPRWRLAAW